MKGFMGKKCSLLVVVAVALLLALGAETAFAAPISGVYLDGKQTNITDAYYDEELGHVYLPLRQTAELLGWTVEVIKDPNGDWPKLSKDGVVFGIAMLSDSIVIGKTSFGLDAPTQICKGKVMVPMLFIPKALNVNARYENNIVNISTTEPVPPRPTLESKEAEYLKKFEKARPFSGVPMSQFKDKWIFGNNLLRAEFMEVSLDELRNTANGIKLGDLKYGSVILHDAIIKPEQREVYFKCSKPNGYKDAGFIVEQINDKLVFRNRSDLFTGFTDLTYIAAYVFDFAPETRFAKLPPVNFNMVKYLGIRSDNQLIGALNPEYQGTL